MEVAVIDVIYTVAVVVPRDGHSTCSHQTAFREIMK